MLSKCETENPHIYYYRKKEQFFLINFYAMRHQPNGEDMNKADGDYK